MYITKASISRVIWMRPRSAPDGAKCLMAWRSCVTDRSLAARKLLIDRSLRRLPDGNRSCNLRRHGEPLQTEVH